jgi:hypothetical protein
MRALRLGHTICLATHRRPEPTGFDTAEPCLVRMSSLTMVGGSLDIWDAILREWTRNVAKYGVGNDRKFSALSKRMGNEWALRMWGDRAFADSLDTRYFEKVPGTERPVGEEQQILAWKKLLAGIDKNERNSFARASEQSSGFGLHMVCKLCGYIGLQASLTLGCSASPQGMQAPMVLQVSSSGFSKPA